MTKQTLQIHSENILPIIKKWLYSDRDIFVRELVSNACDAIYKMKILRDQGQAQFNDEELRIEVKIDKEARTLKFIDTGLGMDAEEVEKYIAQIAFSGAEDFVNKYQSKDEKDQVIGHFGLGFYSAYMVAEKVEIDTHSYKPNAEPVFWSCDGSSEYTIEKGHRETRGTEITLFLSKENDDYLDAAHLRKVLSHYCSFLPYPIYLEDSQINTHLPLWIKPASDCTKEDYLSFYRYLYPMEEEPLFWVHLNVDYPFNLKGILYFPKIRRDFDMEKSTVKLYCNRVFVADNCKDIIPNYLMPLRGVIDSPDIPLNVSRSYLQMDGTVRQLANHISKKVSDSLGTLYRNERERFIECWEDVSLVVKLGVLEDEKFYERVKDFLLWKTVDQQWTTAGEYLERNQEKATNKIFYTKDERIAASFINLYRQKNIEVLCANSPVDSYLMQFLERKLSPVTFQRIDAGVDESLLDKSREKTLLDASGKTEATKLADFIRSKLGDEMIEVEAKSLAVESFPGFVVMDEKERRMREYFKSMEGREGISSMPHFDKKTFIVNTNNPLMSTIQQIDQVNPGLASEMVKQTYELALLSQHEMEPAALQEFVTRTTRVLELLAEQALKKE